jgi:hypothetical protein
MSIQGARREPALFSYLECSGDGDIMDLAKVLAELRRELQQLDAAILSLKRLKEEGRKRGRPPKLPAGVKPSTSGGVASRKRSGDGGA